MSLSEGFAPALDANAVAYKSDTTIHTELLEDLKAAVFPLEGVLNNERDWHPRSSNKVLDLVHPSLFPLVYGRTFLLTEEDFPVEDLVAFCGKGSVVPTPSTLEVMHWRSQI